MVNMEHFLKEFKHFMSDKLATYIKEAMAKGEPFYFNSNPDFKIKVSYLERVAMYIVEVESGEKGNDFKYDAQTFETLDAVCNFLGGYL